MRGFCRVGLGWVARQPVRRIKIVPGVRVLFVLNPLLYDVKRAVSMGSLRFGEPSDAWRRSVPCPIMISKA